MENTFTVTIIKASQELTARQKIQLKDTAECISLDRWSQEPGASEQVIPVDGFVVLAIHNERAKGDTDYEQLVILSGNDKYITGSNSFRSSFLDIYEEMQNDPEPWGIRVIRRTSKNYAGEFLKAVLA